MLIFGTRPGAIKMAPVVKAMQAQPDRFEPIVVVTAQHRKLLDQVLSIFDIHPDFDLNLMVPHESQAERTSKMLHHLENIVNAAQPEMILTIGDSTTTLVASLCAFYHQIPIGHVEAGLRTHDKYAPLPKEMHRQLAAVLCPLYFAHTEQNKQNLLMENKSTDSIFVTGNTSVDALNYTITDDYQHPVLRLIPDNHRVILVTVQRRENMGEPIRRVLHALRDVVETNLDVELVYPVHPNPEVENLAESILGGRDRIHLVEPMDVYDFHNFAARSFLIVTDSGGIQEEAPSMNVPVLLLRDETERPEGIAAGTVKIVGTTIEGIQQGIFQMLHDKKEYRKMAHAKNPFGDGHATERILKVLDEYLD
ncbi:non-hydrolyzing UDP-N-acetylglucosamine 2-epimerase [Paucilactobacillus nenjiangensis]|uniref:non-hydrolyzing UDP-N-acetylglucosamine 2-epimerase n=1 Tax=Paucilactobacillus nenjiangensis TaxID=1296540 RepID=UPI003FA32C5D